MSTVGKSRQAEGIADFELSRLKLFSHTYGFNDAKKFFWSSALELRSPFFTFPRIILHVLRLHNIVGSGREFQVGQTCRKSRFPLKTEYSHFPLSSSNLLDVSAVL